MSYQHILGVACILAATGGSVGCNEKPPKPPKWANAGPVARDLRYRIDAAGTVFEGTFASNRLVSERAVGQAQMVRDGNGNLFWSAPNARPVPVANQEPAQVARNVPRVNKALLKQQIAQAKNDFDYWDNYLRGNPSAGLSALQGKINAQNRLMDLEAKLADAD